MNSIIVDDDAIARLIVRQFLEKTDDFVILDEFSNAMEAIKFINTEPVDCVFLDIHMPHFSGFDFIKTLKDAVKIVLISSDKSFALDAFEYNSVVDYLIKPIESNRFEKTVQKLKKFTFKEKHSIIEATKSNESIGELYINVEKRLIKINYLDIVLVEAKGDYIKIKTATKSYVVHSTLKKIQDKLPLDLFLKIHRSYIINLSKIIDIEDNSVLINQEIIPVSRMNKSELLKRLNLL
jgi:DNA-binding LytR/AlgR family response regulator